MTSFRGKDDLTARQPLTIELPRFLIRAFEQQLAAANADATDEDYVTLENFVEFHLAKQLSIADVANLERQVPGISEAVWQWLSEIKGE
ncbi:MAG TPA: hypothetical protein VF618_17800 [Thermoanaerobaculia bacterium]